MKRIILPLLIVAMCGTLAQAQTMPFDLEIGYRWLDLKGSNEVYRSQINERSGLLLRSFSMSGVTSDVDRFRIDATDLGAGPAGALRLQADRDGVYRFRFAFRSADAYSALPSVALGQHTLDRRRRMADADLEVLPNRAITPFIGFSLNENEGPGTTTITLGQDEFRLKQNLHEHDRELRVGASFRFEYLYGSITQGWRNFRGDETLSLFEGAGNGNDAGTLLGQPITATTLTRKDKTHVKTPYTNAFVTLQASDTIRVIANYSHLAADGDGSENESATGSFASFRIGRFFNGLTVNGSSSAKNTTWRGGGRVEMALHPKLDFTGGYQREHRELNGTALIDNVFLQAITFGGADLRDVTTILQAASAIDRDEDVLHAALSTRELGPWSFRGEYRQTKLDATVAPDLSEIVVPGAQSGDFSRKIHTFDLAGSYSRNNLTVGAAWRKDRANNPIFRTDYLDRERTRLRASWTTPNKFFRAGATWEHTDQDNDRPDTGYDARFRQYGADFELAPMDALHFRVALSQFRADSNILYRLPQNFTLGESLQKEDGKGREAGVTWIRAPFSIDGSLARFDNHGSIPFDVDRYRLRLTYDFKAKAGIAAEFDRDKYDEGTSSDFEASRYGLYLRWRP